MRGNPASVFDTGSMVTDARKYTVANVSSFMDDDKKTDREKELHRNKVVQTYLNAIDARYYAFRSQLGVEGRTGALGFDVVALGFATAGALSTAAAPELAAASGFTSGTRASINKNLLLEKTLPMLFSAMDANRLRQRTVILEHMQKSLGDYPMAAAWSDLQAYQIAGTFDDVVTRISDATASDRVSARAAYNRSLGLACDAKADVLKVTQQIGDLARDALNDAVRGGDGSVKAKGRLRLENIAQAFDITADPGKSSDELWGEIADAIDLDYCEAEGLRKKIDRIIR